MAEKSIEEYARILMDDLRIKDCPAFLTYMGKQRKDGVVLAINMDNIPLTVAEFKDKKHLNVTLVVLNCLSDGYCKVPLENVNGTYKTGSGAKQLTEKSQWDKDSELNMLTCYPYTIVEGFPKDKEERREDFMWQVTPGMAIRTMIWAESARGGKPDKVKENIFPNIEGMDVIPAFTLLEVDLQCKGWSKWEEGDVNPEAKNKPREICPVKKGYGMSVSRIMPLTNASAYSVMPLMKKVIPTSLDENKKVQLKIQETFRSIKDVVQTNTLPFLVLDINEDIHVIDDEANEQLKIVEWSKNGDTTPIDISYADAIKFTNSVDLSSACSLIEVASAAKALKFLVCHNQYRPGKEAVKSSYFGIPLIDSPQLLKHIKMPDDGELSIDESNKFFAIETDFNLMYDEQPDDENSTTASAPLMLLVSKMSFDNMSALHPSSQQQQSSSSSSKKIPCPDFILTDIGMVVNKAYFIRFMNTKTLQIIWAGYINMSKLQTAFSHAAGNVLLGASRAAAGALAGSQKRKRWSSISASENSVKHCFDPFDAMNALAASNGSSSPQMQQEQSEAAVSLPSSTSQASSDTKKKGSGSSKKVKA